MTNQNSPWGSLTYDQTGTQTIIDPNGKPVTVPRYTANTTLTPEQQNIFDKTQAAESNLAGIAQDQTSRLGTLLSDPFSFNNSDAEQWAYDLASPRILKQQQQNQASLESQLVNAGIRRGTPQWDAEMSRLTNANSDQLNQLALTGRSQAFNEALQTRNQALNEPIALASGTQIQNPNSTFAQTPQSQVAGVDYTGLVNQKYQGQLQQYNAQMGALGGLFGGVASIFSDRRLKRDIKRIGSLDNGLPWYEYRYIWDAETDPMRYGVMSDEVRKVMPEAVVVDSSGFDKVRYDMVNNG